MTRTSAEAGKPTSIRLNRQMKRDIETIRRAYCLSKGFQSIDRTTIIAHALRDCAHDVAIKVMLTKPPKQES